MRKNEKRKEESKSSRGQAFCKQESLPLRSDLERNKKGLKVDGSIPGLCSCGQKTMKVMLLLNHERDATTQWPWLQSKQKMNKFIDFSSKQNQALRDHFNILETIVSGVESGTRVHQTLRGSKIARGGALT